MNTPLPEFLRGVKPGESRTNDLDRRIILFEFPHEELLPDLRVREWKVRNGLPQNHGVVLKVRYWEGKKYPHWTKHPKRLVWSAIDSAFVDVDTATVFPDFRRYKQWSLREEAKRAVNKDLFDYRRPVIHPLLFRSHDPHAAKPTGEILVLFGRTGV